ncbi:MAG TPA: ParM/StbA family protein [Bacillales bacterium]|nr:ParM/StbA family protein [Bacillales bacterium]
MADYHFQVGNDIGNSEQDIFVDGQLIRQPNTYIRQDRIPWIDEVNDEAFISNIHEHLIVTIDSPEAPAGLYFIGESAINSKNSNSAHNMVVGIDRKSDSNLPIVNTIGNIAGVAVQRAYQEKKNVPDSMKVTVDMATAIPYEEYKEQTGKTFEKRFTEGTHRATVHVGRKRVSVEVKFEFVKVLPEATPVIFALQKNSKDAWRKDDLFVDFKKKYKLSNMDGKFFTDKDVIHVDIGEGTTEYPITRGSRVDSNFQHGSNNGVGYAIEEATPDFKQAVMQTEVPRNFFSKCLIDGDHKFHAAAMEHIHTPLQNQARAIFDNVKRQISAARNLVDVIVVYGGGSILMKDFLEPELDQLTDRLDIKLLYVPEKYAVTMNAEGLDLFVRGKIFSALKEKVLGHKTEKEPAEVEG